MLILRAEFILNMTHGGAGAPGGLVGTAAGKTDIVERSYYDT